MKFNAYLKGSHDLSIDYIFSFVNEKMKEGEVAIRRNGNPVFFSGTPRFALTALLIYDQLPRRYKA